MAHAIQVQNLTNCWLLRRQDDGGPQDTDRTRDYVNT
jgi:hypothetical protein